MKKEIKNVVLGIVVGLAMVGTISIIVNNKSGENGSVSYSKNELIDLISSQNNKNNYEVEYTINGIKYNKKYLNKKMRMESSEDEKNLHILSYLDFEKNTQTIIDTQKQIAIIKNIDLIEENYMPEDIFEIIKDPNCEIEKEEKILNRDAIVLSYDGKEKTGEGFYFTDEIDENVEIDYTMKIWIDAETGFLLKVVVKVNKINNKKPDKNNDTSEIVFNLKLNSLNQKDVTIPDLSKYKVTDMTSK